MSVAEIPAASGSKFKNRRLSFWQDVFRPAVHRMTANADSLSPGSVLGVELPPSLCSVLLARPMVTNPSHQPQDVTATRVRPRGGLNNESPGMSNQTSRGQQMTNFDADEILAIWKCFRLGWVHPLL